MSPMKLRLADLSPEFMHYDRVSGRQRMVDTLGEANGIWFLCPLCTHNKANGAAIHVHGVLCWSPAVPKGVDPGPGRWPMTGIGFEDLTLDPSIDLSGPGAGCNWHGWIKNGVAT